MSMLLLLLSIDQTIRRHVDGRMQGRRRQSFHAALVVLSELSLHQFLFKQKIWTGIMRTASSLACWDT